MFNIDVFMSDTELIRALRELPAESVLLPVLLQLIVILLAARVGGTLFQRLGQSVVVGEIAAGLILGPSVLGQWDLVRTIFHPDLPGVPSAVSDQLFHWIFNTLSQLGLVFLLFLIGLEFDFSHLRSLGRAAGWISGLGMAIPFGMGLAIARLLHSTIPVHDQSRPMAPFWTFAMFLGTALSITALPILGRLMIEVNIQRSRIGSVVISAAAMGDAAGWILLAGLSALAQSQFDWGAMWAMGSLTLLFGCGLICVGGPLLRRLAASLVAQRRPLSINGMAAVLALLLLCGWVTSSIGIFAIFGAFLFGAVLSPDAAFREQARQQMHSFVTAFFLPIFFTYTGLRMRVQSLDSPELWLLFGLVLAAAIAGKLGGCALAARIGGFRAREALCIGILMNTRALMELIVINVGYDLGVIPESVFCMLVLMALITTLMTTPLLWWAATGTELESLMAQSEGRGRGHPHRISESGTLG